MIIITNDFADHDFFDNSFNDFFDDVDDVESYKKIETKFIFLTFFLFFCSSSSHECIKIHFSSFFFSSTSTSTRIFNQFKCLIVCFLSTRKLDQFENKTLSTLAKLMFSQFVSPIRFVSTSTRNQFEQTIS
jgi:hypothetical protein